MKWIVTTFMIALLALSLGWGSSVSATSSGKSWVDNKAKVKSHTFDYLLENAGIASYIYTEREINLGEAKDRLFLMEMDIEVDEENYIVGKERKSYGQILITKDGLFVSFTKKNERMSKDFDYTLPMDDAIQYAIEQLIGPTVEDFNHIHFQHLDAERYFTARLMYGDGNYVNELTIPSDADILEFSSASGVRRDLDIMSTNVLKPGHTHYIKNIDKTVHVDYKNVSNKSHYHRYFTITSSGSPISIDDKTSVGYKLRVNVSLENKFEKVFSDVGMNNVHYEGISSLVNQDIISGYGSGKFKPWDNIKRNHVAVILSRTANLDTPNNLNDILKVYKDVDSNTYYSEEIAAVTKANIFGGSGDCFQPDKHITREQMATVLVSALELDKYNSGKNVTINLDNVYSTHKKNVQILANLGITNELVDFRPAERITRGAFSSLLNEAMKATERE